MKDCPEEDGLLVGTTANDEGKVTKASLKDRPRILENASESADERGVLRRCLDLVDGESNTGKAGKDA